MAPITQWRCLRPSPPLSHQSREEGGGASRTISARQNCSPTAASRGELTPPLRIVRVQPGTRSSAISSLYALHKVHAASAASSTPINPMDAFASSDSSDDDAPSPKKALPDFTTSRRRREEEVQPPPWNVLLRMTARLVGHVVGLLLIPPGGEGPDRRR